MAFWNACSAWRKVAPSLRDRSARSSKDSDPGLMLFMLWMLLTFLMLWILLDDYNKTKKKFFVLFVQLVHDERSILNKSGKFKLSYLSLTVHLRVDGAQRQAKWLM